MKILNLEINNCGECPMFQDIYCKYLAKINNVHPAILGDDIKVIHKDCPFNKENIFIEKLKVLAKDGNTVNCIIQEIINYFNNNKLWNG